MRKTLQFMVLVLALVLGRPVVAAAGPVGDADLRGKTVCWSYGGTRNTYRKDGSFDSSHSHGTCASKNCSRNGS